MMTGRLGQIASLPAAGVRKTGIRRIAIAGLAVVLLLAYVGGKVQIMRLGYRIDDLTRQKAELERTNRALQIEASSLASPARLEELARKRLGMALPAKENVVAVRRKASAPDSGAAR